MQRLGLVVVSLSYNMFIQDFKFMSCRPNLNEFWTNYIYKFIGSLLNSVERVIRSTIVEGWNRWEAMIDI